jgi:nitroimidazol reductase NimA-like FMN-containing flavoprotein (pyridoxamine 5'-phosphate oxidase superfamily)
MGAQETKFQGCWSGEEVASHLDRSLIPLRLAVHDSRGSPWVLSLWFLYENGALWCATNAKAKLISYLQADPQCGFEVAGETPPYKGIRGKGQATLVPERGGEILLRLLERYEIDLASPLAKSLLAKVEQEVAVCITPSRISSWDFSSRMVGAKAPM